MRDLLHEDVVRGHDRTHHHITAHFGREVQLLGQKKCNGLVLMTGESAVFVDVTWTESGSTGMAAGIATFICARVKLV